MRDRTVRKVKRGGNKGVTMQHHERTEGQRIADLIPDVLHVRQPKRPIQKGWVAVDVTYWKRRVARAVDRSVRNLAARGEPK